MKLHRALAFTIIGVAIAAIIVPAGCKETGSNALGVVVEVDAKDDCRIRVAPESDHRGSTGKWITLAKADCGKYKKGDKYP